jgi:general secretion pathway protein B
MVEPRLGGPDLPAQPGSSAGATEPAPPRDDPTSRTARRTAARQPERSPEPPAATAPRRQAAKTTAAADLPEPFREAVSELRLEALVLADSPKDRKVFINGRRYVEGDKLEDGILVERIIEEGAILSHGGHRFVLRHFR